MLPIQGASHNESWSLERDTQLRTELEATFDGLFGHGVIAGGAVTQTAAFSVQVASGTKFFTQGEVLTLLAAAGYAGPLTAGVTNYLWGLVARIAADQSAVINLDTWA